MRPPLRILAALVATVAIAGGCTGYRPPPPAFHEVLFQPYVVDAGDRLRITVFDQDNLTNSYNVDQAGYLAFPLIGSVPARGYTVKQIEQSVARMLSQGYLRDPDVTVEVERYRPVFVMGEVGAPGQYSYVPGMTIQKAVAVAGGFTPRAQQGSVDVTRMVNGQIMTGRVLTSDPLMPGDTLYVRERLF